MKYVKILDDVVNEYNSTSKEKIELNFLFENSADCDILTIEFMITDKLVYGYEYRFTKDTYTIDEKIEIVSKITLRNILFEGMTRIGETVKDLNEI